MVQELNILIESKIIYPIKHSVWVSNIVLVKKKNGYIRLQVDFRNLNRTSLKDHYPLPSMEQILQRVVDIEVLFLLNGVSAYNQVQMEEEDQRKITFTTKCGTFSYVKIPFVISNMRATFQRSMDVAFKDLINIIILIYLDNVTMLSKRKEYHFGHF